jgi:NitT/TauT family transport system substrate-binding protein
MAIKSKRRRIVWVAALIALLLAAAGCGAAATGGGRADTITIAYQPGIGYAPLLIAKQEGWLNQDLPGRKIVWRQLDSGAAIRDGVLSGQIQVASGGFAPFMVGWARGIDWKVLTSMEDMDLWLMAKDPKYKTLADYKDGGKIAMPAPDSIQAVVLRKAAQNELGNAHALDSNIVSLGHPQGLQALVSGQLAGHLTSPPFEFQEQSQGAHSVATSYGAFGGPQTFNSIYVRQGFYDSNKDAADAIYKRVQQAIQMLHNQPAQAAQILSAESGGRMSAQKFQADITHPGVDYTTDPHGLVNVASFMKQVGLVNKAPANWKEVVLPTLNSANGS